MAELIDQTTPQVGSKEQTDKTTKCVVRRVRTGKNTGTGKKLKN